MITKVKVEHIHPNPFQPRKSQDPESIKALAEEISRVGLWIGAFRGRLSLKGNGHVELCFGHRRLEAVKSLGWTEVEIDVVPLSDDEMALQALVENLQREGLNDADKGDGIKQYIELKIKQSGKKISPAGNKAIKDEVSRILGLSLTRISELLHIAGFEDGIKEEIRRGAIAGKTAVAADRLGGTEAVKAVAEKGMGYRTIEAIGEKVREIEDLDVQKKVREKLAKGEISSADDVVKKARQIQGQQKSKDKLPPDLLIVISNWRVQIEEWTKQLDVIIQGDHVKYLDTQPKVAEKFRAAVTALVERLNKFL